MPRYASRRKSFRSRRRTSKRRAPRRRRRTSRRTTVAVSRTSPFPDIFRTTLKYSELFAMTYAGFAVPASHNFRMNSIHDPNSTGAGHQPLGHDQMQGIYNKYRCFGCRYSITFTNQEQKYAEVAIVLRPNVATSGNFETCLESAHTVFRASLGEKGSGSATRTATGFASVKQIRGISKFTMRGENDYSALLGNNPVISPTIQIYVINQNTSVACTVNVRVNLTYYCEFFDRFLLSQS